MSSKCTGRARRSVRPFWLALSLVHQSLLGACTEGPDNASGTVSTPSGAEAPTPEDRATPSPSSMRVASAPPQPEAANTSARARAPALTLAALAGKELFFDRNLSASKTMSCATCHSPEHAYGPPNERAVQLGGPRGASPGLRAVPSIRYKEFTPGYADLLDNPDGVSSPAPGGGFAWDGRADSLAEQAQTPLLSPFEMANSDAAGVIAKLRGSPSAASFLAAFGARALVDVRTAFENVTLALQSFELEDSSFHPYTSKFDLHEQGIAAGNFAAAEDRGFRVFADPMKGNCAACHYSGAGANDGSSGMFTDYSYEAIGAPRNREIPANHDRSHVDMGLCGPLRKDRRPRGTGASPLCGMFKTPTLRNVATRSVFFHNGVIHSLDQAVRFYNTRDTMPELWYPTLGGTAKAAVDPAFPLYGLVTTEYAGGAVQKFDDLPPAYRKNLDLQMPLDGRPAGSAPPLSESELHDLVCFLKTLTDDYLPGPPESECAE